MLAAPPTALFRVVHDPATVSRLVAARPLVMESIGEQVQRERFDLSSLAVQQWLIGLFKWRRQECVHFALLSQDSQVLWDEKLSEGDWTSVSINLRQIISRAIDIGASAVLLMHNHPSGDPQPSSTDIRETRRIASLLTQLELKLHDHLIVAANRIFSMRAAALI